MGGGAAGGVATPRRPDRWRWAWRGASAAAGGRRTWAGRPRSAWTRRRCTPCPSPRCRAGALSVVFARTATRWPSHGTGRRATNTDVYVQQIGAGTPLRLTTDPGVDYSAIWSPDGRSIAFVRRQGRPDSTSSGSCRRLADRAQAHRIDAHGNLRSRLTLAWCPDSKCLVVTDVTGEGMPDALFVCRSRRGSRQLTFPRHPAILIDTDPAVSPDGRWLVFRRDASPFTGEMYRLPLDGQGLPNGMPVRLTDVRVSATRPAWMPDGRNIMFSSKNTLWRMDAFAPGTPERLAFGLDAIQPAVSTPRRGEALKLVYVRVFSDSNIWRFAPVPASQASAPAPQRIVASTRDDHFPRLSPDGRRLAFFSSRSGEFELWVADPDGLNAIQLTTLRSVPGFPRWSPDSRTLTFHSDPEGHPDVMTISADGGSPGIMTPGAIGGGYPSFSRDGRSIYFTRSDPQGQQGIWRVAASGGAPVRITDVRSDIPIESLDGKTLYYVEDAVRPTALWQQPLAGGPPVKVVDGVFNGNFDVAEQGIYFLQRDSPPPGAGPSGPRRVQTRAALLRVRYRPDDDDCRRSGSGGVRCRCHARWKRD